MIEGIFIIGVLAVVIGLIVLMISAIVMFFNEDWADCIAFIGFLIVIGGFVICACGFAAILICCLLAL